MPLMWRFHIEIGSILHGPCAGGANTFESPIFSENFIVIMHAKGFSAANNISLDHGGNYTMYSDIF